MDQNKWKVVKWSHVKEPEIIACFDSLWAAKLYKFFNWDIFCVINPLHTHWSIEKNV